MNTGYISDGEIDRILGRIGEYRTEPEQQKQTPIDRFNITAEEKARLRAEYSMKKAQQFTMTQTSAPVETSNMRVITNEFADASIIRKTYAFCTDLCVAGLILAGFVSSAIYFSGINFVNNGTTWLAVLYAALFVIYLLYFDGLIGQTPGKMLLNIKIVNDKNHKPSFFRTTTRLFLFFMMPLGLFGVHNFITRTRLVNLD
ncbi:MAG: RDD family protein [Pseudomonadota bacterium]